MADISEDQRKTVLELINKLYDVNSREEALESLARLQCNLNLLSSCVFYSFGIVSILQQEILSIYQYLNEDSIPENIQKRVCNALLILRSLIASKRCNMFPMDLYFFYYLTPILNSPKEIFSNIRKVSIGVLISIVVCPDYQNYLSMLIEYGIFNSCMNNIMNMELSEITSVFYIFCNLFNNPDFVNLYFLRDKNYSCIVFHSLISYIQSPSFVKDEQLKKYLCTLLKSVCDCGYAKLVERIADEISVDKRRYIFADILNIIL